MFGYGQLTDFQSLLRFNFGNPCLEIGLGLLAFGIGFLFLGVILFFDSALLALGHVTYISLINLLLQVLFLSGLGLFAGLNRIVRFFFVPYELKGVLFFFGGISVVLFGFPLIGMLLELYGMFRLFRGFIPVIIKYLYNVPIIGWILWIPSVNSSSENHDENALWPVAGPVNPVIPGVLNNGNRTVQRLYQYLNPHAWFANANKINFSSLIVARPKMTELKSFDLYSPLFPNFANQTPWSDQNAIPAKLVHNLCMPNRNFAQCPSNNKCN